MIFFAIGMLIFLYFFIQQLIKRFSNVISTSDLLGSSVLFLITSIFFSGFLYAIFPHSLILELRWKANVIQKDVIDNWEITHILYEQCPENEMLEQILGTHELRQEQGIQLFNLQDSTVFLITTNKEKLEFKKLK